MNLDEVVVRLVDCPITLRGASMIDEDGVACVYVNSRLSSDAQERVSQHELRHIERNDFGNDLPIRTVEGS